MKNKILSLVIISILIVIISGCDGGIKEKSENENSNSTELTDMQKKVKEYVSVKLTADISHLSGDEKQMLKLLFKAAKLMDDIFWLQNVGDKDTFLATIDDPAIKEFAKINYGAWDELDNLKPFIEGYGEKPAGSEFYPHDMSKEEFDAFDDPDKTNLYTLIQRNQDGALETVWYHEAYKEQVTKAAELLKKASKLAGDKEFANYLELRAEALLTDDYQPSDLAWLDVKNNNVDFVVGPIENYRDQLFGYKAAHESFILIKDKDWSAKLSKYAKYLPQLQKDLPVDPVYKQEIPGSDADLNAYDVVYYAGDCNLAGKTIAINLPNDEEVHLLKGTRKLQLKNAMKAKFDNILVPIADVLIDESQRKYITFDAFFSNVMFHEVAHGMGIKNTITGEGTVRHALKEQYAAIEEGKADILGLFLVTKLHEMGELTETDIMDNYVTFMAGIFRSVRFGLASSHGKANMIRFNFFKERDAFSKNEKGTYSINLEKMKEASAELTQLILKIQGDGAYEEAKKLVEEMGVIKPELQSDLDKLENEGIPKDIVFEQGPEMIGL
ncbi:MAG: Zn-dependent hydrolase [Bacteroidales bacterium]|nr:Zn-dependent hydrolase [Bacteroidales bacterium]